MGFRANTNYTHTHVHDMHVQIYVCIVVMYRAFGFLLQEHCITMTRPEKQNLEGFLFFTCL
jgi:hypothetical protein